MVAQLVQQLRGGGSVEGKPLQFAGVFLLVIMLPGAAAACVHEYDCVCAVVQQYMLIQQGCQLDYKVGCDDPAHWRNGAACTAAEGRRQR
jgi:hypothetical protein